MPADASIYGQVGRFKSMQDYDNEANASELNKLQLMLHRQQYGQGQQAIADQNALRDAYRQFGTDTTANANQLFSRGLGKEGLGYQKSVLDNQKTEGEIGKTKAQTGEANATTDAKKLDSSIKAHDFHVQLLGSLQSPDQVPAWVDAGVKSGVFTPEQGQAGLQRFAQSMQQPGGFDAWRQAALQGGQSATDQLKQQQQLLIANNQNATSRANNADTNATHIETTGMSNAVTMRGQNMTDARSRESNVATMTKPFEVTGPDGTPMLVRQDKQGNISPVVGYNPKAGTAKPLTEAQAKDLGYGSRMREADKVINDLEGQYSPMALNAKISAEGAPIIGGITGAVANKMLSSQGQRAEQAQRDFVNAVLRRESGAAISASEFDNARKQYFPQPGDGPDVLKQKAANRKLAQEGVMAAVPTGQRGSIGPQTAGGIPPADAIAAELARRAGK